MRKLALTLLSLSVATAANAGQLGEPGFSGEVSVLTGVASGKSNFDTDVKEKKGTLNSEADSETEALVVPLGQLRYTFGQNSNHQLFMGTSRDDIAVGDFALEFGYKIGVGEDSFISVSYLPSLVATTWEDPFITGEREETDIASSAFRLKYDNMFDSNFSADIAYYTAELDQEKSGSGVNGGQPIGELDRDGHGIYTKFSYSHSLNQTSVIEPSFIYQTYSADGKAMSKDSYGAELSYKKLVGQHAYVLSANYLKTSYDGVNEIFNETQEDNEYGVFAAYEYKKFMGWENWAFNGVAGYEVKSSNIEFYNEDQLLFGVGITYAF